MSMRYRGVAARIAILILVAWLACTDESVFAAESQWITTGETGRLIYVPDAEGDRILDFSNVGYQGRGTALIPTDVANVVTVSPIGGDDTTSIQNAINLVSDLPIGPDGYRGAVQLAPGTFDIDGQLEIRRSGVVLRGSGRDAGGTVLHGRNPLTGGTNPNQRPLVRIYGSGSRTNIGSTISMVDKVVPAGSRSFRVSTTSDLAVGDSIRIERPSTQEWIEAVGMDNPPNGDPPWTPGSMNIRYDRVITRIEGDRVFVDAPLANSFDQQYGGGTLREYVWNGAVENIGIENLRGDTDFDFAEDEDHAWEFISIGVSQNSSRAQNVWVKDIAAEHFGDSVVVANPGSKWVTVDNAISQNPISQITGSRRYTYDLSGELNLVTNAQADEGRHDFVTNSTRPAGPNVFHNSTATNANSDTGPHQRWSSGVLFDNISVEGNAINARNRGSFGTSHGWSGANIVVWNSTADSFRIQNPPTAQNWLVGSTGTIVEDTTFGPQPPGNYDSHGTPVTAGGTNSLYEAQVNDSQDIEEFHAGAEDGNWNDSAQWDQQVAPTDAFAVTLRDYLVGDIDGFTNDGAGSLDDAFVDPAWQAAIDASSNLPTTGFDDLSGNQNVAFTIQHVLDPGEQVVHGFLALGLKQTAGGLVNTDFVQLFDRETENRQSFTDLGWDTQVNTSETFVGVLDLGSSLDMLQSGSVNVQINDDTGVDWAIYTVAVATPKNDSSSTAVFIDGGGTTTVDTAVGPVGALTVGGSGAGTLLVADSGDVDVNGDFVQTATGSLVIEIADVATMGSLDVENMAALAGSLEVLFADQFEPTAGDSFQVLTAGSVTGTFDEVTLPSLTADFAWLVDYQATSVDLNITFAADFNGDGTVDGLDLATLQTNYGTLTASHSQGDADRDGDVDGSDMLFWQRQAGSSVSFFAASQVPEPTALTALLVALTNCLSLRAIVRY